MSLKNVWNNISIYCLNHANPLDNEMSIVSNTDIVKTPFYACKSNLDSNSLGEITFSKNRNCANRLNLDDYQGLVLKFLSIIEEKGFSSDLTNFSFAYKGVRQKILVTVLEYKNNSNKVCIRIVSVLVWK